MVQKHYSRRDFLRSTLGGAAGLYTLGAGGYFQQQSGTARANESDVPEGFQPKDHYFVFYYFPGGWDTMLSWDPRDPAIFTPATMGETGIFPAYQLLDTVPNHGIYVDSALGKLGGFVGDLRLPKYTDRMCLVRGINMETLAHEAGSLRFRTGRMPEGVVPTRDSSDVVLASLLGANELVPNISLGVTSVNKHNPSYASPLRATHTSGVAEAMLRSNTLPAAVEAEIQALLNQHQGCDHAQQSEYLTRAHDTRSTVNAMLASSLAEKVDFKAQTDEVIALRDHYGFSTSNLRSAAALSALAEVALTQQVSRCVSIRVPAPSRSSNNFDTHSTLEQGPDQMLAHNAVARLMDRLEVQEYPDGSGDSWLDRTTIMCYSEFSRSPLLEPDGDGRGHWLTNACLLAGGGFKMNQVIGASSDVGMAPRAIDINTGEGVPNGLDMITPDRIMRTVYTMLGYTWDVADLRVEPIPALLKSV